MRRLSGERGSVMVIALLVAAMMLLLALSALAVVDTQTRQSGRERARESAFNLAEGALTAQTFTIAQKGVAGPFATCTNANASSSELCPDPTTLAGNFNESDFQGGQATWQTEVRDNGLTTDSAPTRIFNSAYADGAGTEYPFNDANGDKQLFVRSKAIVTGRPRTVVALVALQEQQISFPRYTISASYFGTTNSGNKTIVDAGTSGGVQLRCADITLASCLNVRSGQISGNVTGGASSDPAISSGDLTALTNYATTLGTHYAGCPTDLSGTVVVIDSGNCTINPSAGQSCCNTPTSPGLLIIKNGTLTLAGGTLFNGIIYMANQQGSSGNLLTLGGTAEIVGGLMVDGNGGIAAGASGLNFKFGSQAFDSVKVAGTAGVVQNTFREL